MGIVATLSESLQVEVRGPVFGRGMVFLRKEFLGCRAGAASGTTAPAPSRPYRGFHCCWRRQLRHDGLQTFGSAGAGMGWGICEVTTNIRLPWSREEMEALSARTCYHSPEIQSLHAPKPGSRF